MQHVLAFRHVAREPLGTIDGVLRRAGLTFEYVDLFADRRIEFDPRQFAGLVVLGGPMNVDEANRYPFLTQEIRWIEAALADDLPILGICLGSQLLAAALGARVWHSPTKEIGWYDIETTAAARDDRLLKHLASRERVFQWHGDTFDLPSGAVHLARAPICEHQAFRYGPAAWAIQFHLEVTEAIIECWLTDPDGCVELAELDYIDPARIRAETPRRLPAMEPVAERVFSEFAAVCRQRAGA